MHANQFRLAPEPMQSLIEISLLPSVGAQLFYLPSTSVCSAADGKNCTHLLPVLYPWWEGMTAVMTTIRVTVIRLIICLAIFSTVWQYWPV